MRKSNKNDEAYTVKIDEHEPTFFALAVCYSPYDKRKNNEHFCYTSQDCLYVFADKLNKILSVNFHTFLGKNWV